MLDPITGFLIEIKKPDENNSDDGILNPYTGILELPVKYPCIDLDNDSDEASMTENGVSKEKKRIWHETDKQEWLSVYQEYMQTRSESLPKPICFQTEQDKVLAFGGIGFKKRGRPRIKVRRVAPKDGKSDNLELDSLERARTVKDLRRISNRRRVKKDLMDSECGSSIDLEGSRSNDEVRDLQIEGFMVEVDKSQKEDLSQRDRRGITKKQDTSKKVNVHNLRYNSLQLIKYTNICLYESTENRYMCYSCPQRFKSMQTLRQHVQESHSYDQISEIFKDGPLFHKADITDLECRICGDALDSYNVLKNHLIGHEITFKAGGFSLIPYKFCSDVFTCQICKATFATRCRLEKHMDSHFLNYLCPVCNIGFHSSRALKMHSRVHLRRSKASALIKNVYVKRRRKLKGVETQIGRLNCNWCTQKFSSDCRKLKHVIEQHRGESKLFRCEFCAKIFMTVHGLTKHMHCVHREELYK